MYIEHNGIAMGAHLAPLIADVFMAHIEISFVDRLMEMSVCEWHRYVDDTSVPIEHSANVSYVLHILNNFQLSISRCLKSLEHLNDKHSRQPSKGSQHLRVL
jgi:hypothetical protein